MQALEVRNEVCKHAENLQQNSNGSGEISFVDLKYSQDGQLNGWVSVSHIKKGTTLRAHKFQERGEEKVGQYNILMLLLRFSIMNNFERINSCKYDRK